MEIHLEVNNKLNTFFQMDNKGLFTPVVFVNMAVKEYILILWTQYLSNALRNAYFQIYM